MRRVAALTLIVFFALPLRAQSVRDTTEHPTSQIAQVLLGIGAYVLTVPVHEFGHYVTASAYGAHPYMDFTPFKYGPTAIAATVFDDTGFTKWQEGVTAIAGVASTRLLAEAASGIGLSLPHRSKYPTATEQFMSFLYLFARLDFPGYVVQDAYARLNNQGGGDMDVLVTQIAGQDGGRQALVYAGLLAVATVDVFLDLPRILYHVAIARGKRVDAKNARWGAWGFSLQAVRGGLKANYSMSW